MNNRFAAFQMVFYEPVIRNGQIWLRVGDGYDINGKANIHVGELHSGILVAEIDDSMPFGWLIRS